MPKGLAKGALVMTGMGFPAIVQDNYRNRSTRLCEVFGIAHEWGSVYTNELRPIDNKIFELLKKNYGHSA